MKLSKTGDCIVQFVLIAEELIQTGALLAASNNSTHTKAVVKDATKIVTDTATMKKDSSIK